MSRREKIEMAVLAALMHHKPDYLSPSKLDAAAEVIAGFVEGALGPVCLDCGGDYDNLMACDLVFSRAQWLKINPQDGGVLCANCMLRRAAALPGTVNVTGRITNADNSLEIYQGI